MRIMVFKRDNHKGEMDYEFRYGYEFGTFNENRPEIKWPLVFVGLHGRQFSADMQFLPFASLLFLCKHFSLILEMVSRK